MKLSINQYYYYINYSIISPFDYKFSRNKLIVNVMNQNYIIRKQFIKFNIFSKLNINTIVIIFNLIIKSNLIIFSIKYYLI